MFAGPLCVIRYNLLLLSEVVLSIPMLTTLSLIPSLFGARRIGSVSSASSFSSSVDRVQYLIKTAIHIRHPKPAPPYMMILNSLEVVGAGSSPFELESKLSEVYVKGLVPTVAFITTTLRSKDLGRVTFFVLARRMTLGSRSSSQKVLPKSDTETDTLPSFLYSPVL